MTIPIPLQEALRDSITSGSFVNAKFWLFSKRTSNSGRIGGPKALFVNERVAKSVPRLGAFLEEQKSKENLRTRFPESRKPYTSHYDYEDDSDLEGGDDDDDDDDDISDDEPTASPQVAAEKPPASPLELMTTEKSDGKSRESSDIISVSDLDSLFSEPPDVKDESDTAHVGKVVVVEDVAFITFQALLRYLYTNEIEFAPWGSAERRKARALETVSESYGIPKPSPKSIYRLADKYNIPELKELALRQIQQGLSKCDIVKEALSKYTSWYPELRELEVRQLARALLSTNSASTLQSLQKGIEKYTRGRLPHAIHAISTIYELMESDDSVEVEEIPLPASPFFSQQPHSDDWAGLKKAIVSSLTSGTFLDSQFYAVESKSCSGLLMLRPIYFCSTVDDSLMPRLIASSSKIKGRKALVPPPDMYDSDIEDSETGQECSMDHHPRSKCIRENPTPTDPPLAPALVLNCGAAKTWSAIFLYMYTGQVAFAAIDSQRITHNGQNDDSEGETKDRGEVGAPPPAVIAFKSCSPKSIYSLANKVGLTELRDLAIVDIQSKLDEKNIIEELFSPFTANHTDVREMEYKLYHSKLKPLVNRTLIRNVIESSSTGEYPHHSVAMELIIEKSIQEHRKKILKAKNGSKPASAPRPKTSTKAPTAPTPQAKPPAPVPAPRSVSQSSSSSALVSAPAKVQALTDSSTPSEPRKKTKPVYLEEPPTYPRPDSPCYHVVDLRCSSCKSITSLSGKRLLHRINHPGKKSLECGSCGIECVHGTYACVKCRGRLEL